MNQADLKKLRQELKDAKYAGKDHVAIRDMLREITDQVDDAAERPTWQLLGCCSRAEITAAMAVPLKAQQLTMVLSMGRFSPTENTLAAVWADIFGDNSQPVKGLRKLGKRAASKAEFLGLGNVTESDVADAQLRTAD